MIRDDTDGYVRVVVLLIFHTGDLAHPCSKRQHSIHVKNGIHILHGRSQSL